MPRDNVEMVLKLLELDDQSIEESEDNSEEGELYQENKNYVEGEEEEDEDKEEDEEEEEQEELELEEEEKLDEFDEQQDK